MPSPAVLASVLRNRATLIELVLAAVVLGLGVNLLATAAAAYFSESVGGLALLGLSLCVLAFALIARRTFSTAQLERKFEGFVCFKGESSDLISIPRYEYSEELESFFEALFAENSAPRKLWESDPVHKTIEHDLDSGSARVRTTEAGQLLIEATEYFVLEKLSTHLTDYFNQSGLEDSELRELSREDVPSIVFRNRFLDTFSRPMRERAAFADTSHSPGDLSDRIVSAFGPGGLRFSKFDLVLPVGAMVKRLSPRSIQIEAPKFTITLAVAFDGFGSNLPRGFEELYLGDVKFTEVSTYQIFISAIVKFKPLALLSRSGWEYHSWLDSFLTKLERDFSKREFLARIRWNTAVTVGRVVERTIANHTKADNTPTPPTGTFRSRPLPPVAGRCAIKRRAAPFT